MPLQGERGPALFFKVTGPITVLAKNGLARCVIRDAAGMPLKATIQKAPDGLEQMVIKDVPEKTRGLWSIHGPQGTVVYLDGSPPVFAVADPARFYLPSDVPPWKAPGR
jgi:hypothetical protein